MKVIKKDDKKESADGNYFSEKIQNNLEFHASQTVFGKSFLFLIVEAAGPFLLLFFLTSPDLSFAYHYDVGVGIGLGGAMIASVFLLTCTGFLLHCHQADQFTYTIALSWVLYGGYLTGYGGGGDKILYRCLLSLVFLLVVFFFGIFMTIGMRNLREYFQIKRNDRRIMKYGIVQKNNDNFIPK